MAGKKKIIFLLGIVFVSVAILLVTSGKKTFEQKAYSDKIAVIYIDGVITGTRSTHFLSEDGGTGAIIRQLHRAAEDPSVKAIVLRINSPGGSTTATEEIGAEIKKIRQKGKLIVTSMGDAAASGGYWLAACTDLIYANPSTLTGSIGVYMPYSNWEELYKKIGIRSDKIKSGAHKDILANDRPMTGEERAILQALVDEIYENFIAVVAEGRKMDVETVRKLADGRIYTGKQAKEVGLVDELGNLYDAIDKAAALTGIQGKPEIKEFKAESPLAGLLSSESKVDLFRAFFFSMPEKMKNEADVPMTLMEKWQE